MCSFRYKLEFVLLKSKVSPHNNISASNRGNASDSSWRLGLEAVEVMGLYKLTHPSFGVVWRY